MAWAKELVPVAVEHNLVTDPREARELYLPGPPQACLQRGIDVDVKGHEAVDRRRRDGGKPPKIAAWHRRLQAPTTPRL